MNILNKLTKKNLFLNRQRSIVTIIGIMLSCALITALMSLIISFQETLMVESLKSYGNRHVTFEDVSKEDLNLFENHKDIESHYITGYKTALKTQKEDISHIGVVALDDKALLDLENIISEGRVPKNENEIVIDLYYSDMYNVSIGDTISLDIGNRYIDGELLNEHNPANYDENGNLLETFEINETKNYKIVGISNYYTFLSTDYYYNVYTYEENITNNINVHVTYKDPSNFETITNEINDVTTDNSYGKYNISYNSEYLRWSGYITDDMTREFLYIIAAVISFIIMATSIFCIRNSFAISTTEKTKMYGMLSSVGATPKQIKKSVLKEGFYLGLVGIPLGIIFGIIATYALVNVVNVLLPTLDGFEFIVSISIPSIIISIILASITIYFSALGSARKASKITEIEAIKNQRDIKIKNSKLKVPKIINKIFKIGGVFAYKNMKRNKSKYRTTIISLAVSVAIFISLSYFMQIGFDLTEEIYKVTTYDLVVSVNGTSITNEEQLDIFKDLADSKYVDRYSVHTTETFLTDEQNINSRVNNEYFREETNVEIISIGEEEYQKILKDNDLNYHDVYNKGIILNNTYEIVNTDGDSEMVNLLKENITNINIYDYYNTYITDIDLIEIDSVVLGGENYYSSYPVIIVSNEYFEEISTSGNVTYLYLKANNIQELHNEIVDYDTKNSVNFYTHNMEEYIEMQENMLILIGIFLYGFIGVIILISLTNIFNTITTNMKLRSKEFAMLKSIGMTNKEFINMIRLESIFYGTKALFWGLSIGLMLAYLLYYLMKKYEMLGKSELLGNFNIPWIYIIIAVTFVFLIINLIMRTSLSKINKQNILETIKNENI